MLTCKTRREIFLFVSRIIQEEKRQELKGKRKYLVVIKITLTCTANVAVRVVRLLNTKAAVEIVKHAVFVELSFLAYQW